MTGTHGFTSKSLVCEIRFVFEKETQDEYNHHFIRFEGYLIYLCTQYMPHKPLIKILLVYFFLGYYQEEYFTTSIRIIKKKLDNA